uniref:Uncharacterized protein n=1 Tax=Panagrolaimus sp. ES5 TaxID=591445 RepID=A0AC34FJM3_9BILA
DSVIFRLIHGATKLGRIIFLDRLPEKHEAWIKRHSTANLTFPVTKISDLAKSLTTSTLVINPVDYTLLFLPFKDFARYQSIKKLEINGRFNEYDLNTDENIEKFIAFVNRFPSLTSIDASFTLHSLREDSYDGYGFYETMKEIQGQVFKGFSSELHGVIHFGASVHRFEDMRLVMLEDVQRMKNDIKGIWSKAATPITFDEEHSIIQRKFKIHAGLTVEFSIFAIFSNL